MNTKAISFGALLLVAIAGMSLCVGCENKLTRDRWEMIKVGVDDKETVEATIGKPQEKPFGHTWWYYKDNLTVKVYFDKNGKVRAKKWIDEEKGQILTEPKGWIDKKR